MLDRSCRTAAAAARVRENFQHKSCIISTRSTYWYDAWTKWKLHKCHTPKKKKTKTEVCLCFATQLFDFMPSACHFTHQPPTSSPPPPLLPQDAGLKGMCVWNKSMCVPREALRDKEEARMPVNWKRRELVRLATRQEWVWAWTPIKAND